MPLFLLFEVLGFLETTSCDVLPLPDDPATDPSDSPSISINLAVWDIWSSLIFCNRNVGKQKSMISEKNSEKPD